MLDIKAICKNPSKMFEYFLKFSNLCQWTVGYSYSINQLFISIKYMQMNIHLFRLSKNGYFKLFRPKKPFNFNLHYKNELESYNSIFYFVTCMISHIFSLFETWDPYRSRSRIRKIQIQIHYLILFSDHFFILSE